jgi:hypothetical protein
VQYVIVERRLRGTADQYLGLIAELARESAAGHVATRAYVSESDPSAVLSVGLWTDQALERSAVSAVAARPAVVARLQAMTAEESAPRWYRPWRWIERVGERAELVAAVIQRVAPADERPHLEWIRRIQDAVLDRGLAIGQTVLLDDADPGLVVQLAEYGHASDRSAVLSLVEADPSPVALLSRRVFVGKVGYRWDRMPSGVASPARA